MGTEADELELRTARLEDAAAIAHVYVETWRAAYTGILPPQVLHAVRAQDLTTSWRAIIQKAIASQEVVLVASLGNHVVGFASAGRQEQGDLFFRDELKTLYVLPDHQRRGVGTGLLCEVLQLIALPALVWIVEHNAAGRAFYEYMGALPVRRRREMMAGVSVPLVGYAFFDPA